MEHSKTSENCLIAAIASGNAILMQWFCVLAIRAAPQNALDHRVINA